MSISRRTFLTVAAGATLAALAPAVAWARRPNCYSDIYSDIYH